MDKLQNIHSVKPDIIGPQASINQFLALSGRRDVCFKKKKKKYRKTMEPGTWQIFKNVRPGWNFTTDETGSKFWGTDCFPGQIRKDQIVKFSYLSVIRI